MIHAGRMILKSSSIEDTAPKDGVMLGKALAMDCKRVVVARDLMKSSTMMADALISGLLFNGVDVIDAGTTSAPAVAKVASKGDCAVYVAGREGMMSGYILLNPDGSMFRDRQIRHLEMVYQKPPKLPEYNRLGTYTKISGVVDEYNRSIIKEVSRSIKCLAILDCRCGSTSESIPQILNSLGADVFAFNTHRDPDYRQYARAGDKDGTRNLEDIVKSSPGSIGIRMNGTGTAMTVIDEQGEVLPMDVVFTLLAMYLRPKSIAISSEASSLISDAFMGNIDIGDITTPHGELEPDREVILTEESASAVCDAVVDGAEMGYYHGSIVFGDWIALGDGILAATQIVRMAGDNSLHGLSGTFPEYFRMTYEYSCDLRVDVFRRVTEECLEGGFVRYGDAYRVDMDGGWYIIRYRNGTEGENFIDIVAESQDKAYLVGMMEIVAEKVHEIILHANSIHDL